MQYPARATVLFQANQRHSAGERGTELCWVRTRGRNVICRSSSCASRTGPFLVRRAGVATRTFTRSADAMSYRILFTCRPLSGHFDPLLPLADAARVSGHEVAFASGAPVVGRARDAGFTAFEAGTADTFRAEWAPRFPGFTTLVGDAQRTFFFTE